MSFVSLRYEPMRSLYEINMSFGEYSQKTRLTNTDGDNDVSVIMSNMLDDYQVHKEVCELSHEDIEGDSVITGVDYHDHALKDVKTHGQSVICKNEVILLIFTSKNDMSPQSDEDQSISGDSEKHVVSLIFVEIYVNWFLNASYDIAILRDNEDLLLHIMVGSKTMSYVQQRVIEYEFNMTEDVRYLPDFQKEKMKNSSCDSLGSSCTHLGGSNPMIKDVIKIDKEDVVQVMTNIVRDKMVIEIPRLMKNEQASLVVRGVKRSPKSYTDAEANALAIVKRMNVKEILTLKVSYLVEESPLKRMWLHHKRICLERKLSTKVFRIEEVVELLKEGCGILSLDNVDHIITGSSGKQLLEIKLVLKENNIKQDVLTLFWNILRVVKYSTIPNQQRKK